MQLTLLISSLNNDVDELINKMNISSCAVIVNQCDKEDETVIELDLDSLFAETLENYDFMGDNFVNRQDWERIAACALKAGGIWKEVIEILSPWVEDTFSKYDYFTIIGM